VRFFESVGSTNTEAKELVAQGEKEGLIVVSARQTAGRGRKERHWLSPEGGLYFSLVLTPRLGFENVPLLGLLGACAVARSLSALGVENATVKWPNDVLIGDSKIAGILSEAVSVGDRTVGVIIGIGVNQNCPIVEMPPGLKWPTTSVIDELGAETSTEELLCSIVNEIDTLLQSVEKKNSYDDVLNLWRELSSTIGSRVRIHDEDKTIVGLAKDISSDGTLIVETDDGLIHVLLGDVSHLREQE
jgi:BirA family biotin operon repressor/biotin-[acetyl-CoA-carboxylase] ligase